MSTVFGYAAPAGDHNDNPARSVPLLIDEFVRRNGRTSRLHQHDLAVRERSSWAHLQASRSTLTTYAADVATRLGADEPLLLVHGRCATSLATIPLVRRAEPEAVVVWLDAHADLNVPGSSPTDYLGGMALSGPLGWWDSGFGSGLSAGDVVLVGTRAIDPVESEQIERHGIAVIDPERTTGDAVTRAVAGRPVHFHLDCDVLRPGTFATDYREPGGLTLHQLHEVATVLARDSRIVAVEVAEWEGPAESSACHLLDALLPLVG